MTRDKVRRSPSTLWKGGTFPSSANRPSSVSVVRSPGPICPSLAGGSTVHCAGAARAWGHAACGTEDFSWGVPALPSAPPSPNITLTAVHRKPYRCNRLICWLFRWLRCHIVRGDGLPCCSQTGRHWTTPPGLRRARPTRLAPATRTCLTGSQGTRTHLALATCTNSTHTSPAHRSTSFLSDLTSPPTARYLNPDCTHPAAPRCQLW